MKSYTIHNLGDDPDIKVTVDKYGCVTIGEFEFSCDDIQIIANLAISQRAAYFTSEGGESDEQQDV